MTSPSTIDWQFSRFADLTPFDLYDVLAARQNVFILEQTCLYPDIDGYDLEAHHLLGWRDVDGKRQLAAYLRVLAPGAKYDEMSHRPRHHHAGGTRQRRRPRAARPGHRACRSAAPGPPHPHRRPAIPGALLRELRLRDGVGAVRRRRHHAHRHAALTPHTSQDAARRPAPSRMTAPASSSQAGGSCSAIGLVVATTQAGATRAGAGMAGARQGQDKKRQGAEDRQERRHGGLATTKSRASPMARRGPVRRISRARRIGPGRHTDDDPGPASRQTTRSTHAWLTRPCSASLQTRGPHSAGSVRGR